MKQPKAGKSKTKKFKIPKSPTGIQGLDEITFGGIPKNRPTLLLGNTGSVRERMQALRLIPDEKLKSVKIYLFQKNQPL